MSQEQSEKHPDRSQEQLVGFFSDIAEFDPAAPLPPEKEFYLSIWTYADIDSEEFEEADMQLIAEDTPKFDEAEKKTKELEGIIGSAQVTESLKDQIAQDFRELFLRINQVSLTENLRDGRFPYLDGTEGIYSSDQQVRMRVERAMYKRESGEAVRGLESPLRSVWRTEVSERLDQADRDRFEVWRAEFRAAYGEDLMQHDESHAQ